MKTNIKIKIKESHGYTLIELLIVCVLLLIFSALMAANLRRGENQYALERSLHKLNWDFRRAESMAMNTLEFKPYGQQSQIPMGGYGLYFDILQPNHYILFADLDSDKNYDSSNELVEDIRFENNISITEIRADVVVSSIAITFLSPDPIITIKKDDSQTAQSATITLNSNKKIVINQRGLIEIQ